MQCTEIRNYFADYLAEDLEASTKEEFSRHLKECPACHAELEALTDLWVKLGSVPAGEPASPDLEVRLRASAAHALDVEDPYYGGHADFEDVYTVISAALPGLHTWVDEQLGAEER